jgi:hypothetical protein
MFLKYMGNRPNGPNLLNEYSTIKSTGNLQTTPKNDALFQKILGIFLCDAYSLKHHRPTNKPYTDQ